MKRPSPLALCLLALLFSVALVAGQDAPYDPRALEQGRYRKQAKDKTIARWKRDYRDKQDLVPGPPAPAAPKGSAAVDFSGTYRFGRYDYPLVIEQKGDEVTFRSGGVDHQDIGGAFQTIGAGVVRGDRIHARWWCVDLTRNYANNGGAEMWFFRGDRNRIYASYYHDADERIEDGYGVRVGTYVGQRQHYRIRMKHPVKTYERPLVLRGSVRSRAGAPLEDAVVMLRHEEGSAVRTDARGRWSIPVRRLPTVQMVSAASPGYRTRVQALLRHAVREIDFVLEPSPFFDDPRYEFVDPTPSKGEEIWRCGNCHRNSYEEWRGSRHALAAKSAVTRAQYELDFLPALGRGEADGDEGLCGDCHAPGAALDGRRARLDALEGVHLLGNHCDFCHKVHHTEDPQAAGARGSLAPGRPAPDDGGVLGPIKRVYGPLADSDYYFMGPVYNPYFSTSALCAGCHQHTTPRGIAALNTYAEWRAWAATQRELKSCQSCHMPTGTSMERNKLAKRICINGLRRPPEQIHDHSFRGRELLVEAVVLDAKAERTKGGGIEVRTRVGTRDVGHRVPTGSGDKHLLLVVTAVDSAGRPLALREGPRVPAHAGGAGDPLALSAEAFEARTEAGDFAGMPGREFAQVLADREGGTHVPFWRARKLVRDTRLEPGQTVEVRHAFEPAAGPVRVQAELLHRLRFKGGDVARGLKGDGVRPLDVVVVQKNLEVR